MRDKINQWLRANYPNLIISVKTVTGISKPLDEIMGDCFDDLQGWVSVNDRLPDENKSYLVNTVEDDVIELGFYRCPEYENFNWHCPVTHDDVDHTVAHWQPLPEPPK